MKRILITLAVIGLAPMLVAPAAEAGVFSVGFSFNVGDLFFDLGFGGPHYSAHAGHHVYRVNEPFHYRGYRCHSGCYRAGGYSYHHANCPAVAYHFRTHRFDPYVSYPSFFAPRNYGHYSYYNYGRYGHHGYRYDHYRYDRYRSQRYYRNHRRDYRPRHHGHRGHGSRYRSDDRRRDRSHFYDRDRRDRRDGRGRGAYSTRPPAQRRDAYRDRGDNRNRERGRHDARRARPRHRD